MGIVWPPSATVLRRLCKEALEILQKTAPDAASWWRENVPRLRARTRKFLFQESLCEMVDRASANKHLQDDLPQSRTTLTTYRSAVKCMRFSDAQKAFILKQ